MQSNIIKSLNVELCCYSLSEALLAQRGEADRIEFCTAKELDGISPSRESIIEVLNQITIPVYIIVRPRGGNFIYTQEEINWMCDEMKWAVHHGVSGFVFGTLNDENKIDIINCKKLIDASDGFPCTFHRAFDTIENKLEAMDILYSLGFKRILTSGGVGNAEKYINVLKELVAYANDRIIIIPGGGIRLHNVLQIVNETKCSEIHSSDGGIINIRKNKKIICTVLFYALIFVASS
ncbi:MAG: copper homeostasis protein CutC [Bacteroidota bacterium]|nr:copper homeostasis protein CutC [Bacteroidota bacterium]